MDTYFKDINTLEELRKQYKELLKKYHPDNDGDVAIVQEVNAEYIYMGGWKYICL